MKIPKNTQIVNCDYLKTESSVASIAADGLHIQGLKDDIHRQSFLAYQHVMLYIYRTALLIQRQLITGEPWLS